MLRDLEPMNKLFWKKVSIITLVFGLLYVALFLMSGLIVHLVDYVNWLITGNEYVDGWTPGFMVWTALLFIIPVFYLITLTISWVRSRKNN